MKIAMMTYTMSRGEWAKKPDIRELCEFTRQLGVEAIDWGGTYGSTPDEIRRTTDGYGIKNICYTFDASIQNPDKAIRSKGLEQVKAGLEVASVLGADKIMLPIPGVKGFDREEIRKICIESLATAVELAKPLNIAVTIEHFHGTISPFIRSTDMNEAVRAVPDLRITFDNGNIFTGGEEPAQGFLNSAPYIVHAHFKDWERCDGGLYCLNGESYRGVLVGEGLVDPVPCLKAMQQSGYKGYIDFEYEGQLYSPHQACLKGIPMLQELIDMISDA